MEELSEILGSPGAIGQDLKVTLHSCGGLPVIGDIAQLVLHVVLR